VSSAESRPAFYALAPSGARDYWTLLHPPYTLWHLSYVVVGACLAPVVSGTRLGLVVGAFALAVGIGAHALDELNGRPLRTRIPDAVLIALAVLSIAGAAAIGILAATLYSPWLLAFVAAGVFLVVAYNIELFGGHIHTDLWFALAWGAFPVLTAYFTMAETLRWDAILAASFALLASLAQRSLSTVARGLRRRTTSVTGVIERTDGTREPITPERLLRAPETALRALSAAMVALAAAFILLRFA
jgi:hypothetical protein